MCSIEVLACELTILAPSTCAIQCHMAASFLSLTDENHDYGEDVSLSSLLRFMTGLSVFPPMGLSTPLQIKYHSTKDHGNQFHSLVHAPILLFCPSATVLMREMPSSVHL